MTGGGAASAAFVKADGFLSIPGTPTYYRPGRNIQVEELELSRQLQRLREEASAEAVDSLAQNLEGAFAASWIMSKDTHGDVRDIVFNDAGTGFTSGRTALSRWFVSTDYLTSGGSSTVERELRGCIPLDYELSYEQGGVIRESLSMGYADEVKNTSVTPSSVTGPTDGNDVPFHGAELTVDTSSVTKLQSATLSFSNISRFQRDNTPTPADAVLAAPEVTLDATAIYDTDDRLERVYGAAGSSATQDRVNSVSGALAFDVAGNSVATYNLPRLKPDTYSWDALVDAETDLTDPVSYQVTGGVTIS